MTNRTALWATLTAIAFAAMAHLSAAAAQENHLALRPVDDSLELLVTQALAEDPDVESSEIFVVADGTDVTLYGSVDSKDDRQRAQDVAARVAGAPKVHNEIQVVPPPHLTSKSDRAIESDFWAFLDQRLDKVPATFDIRVQNGEATISGRVDSRAQRQSLIDAAFDAGALLVKPQLEIDPS